MDGGGAGGGGGGRAEATEGKAERAAAGHPQSSAAAAAAANSSSPWEAAPGAFVHGLEDDAAAVRECALEALASLSRSLGGAEQERQGSLFFSSRFSFLARAAAFAAGCSGDEAPAVRAAALRCLRAATRRLPLLSTPLDEHLPAVLSGLRDSAPRSARAAATGLLTPEPGAPCPLRGAAALRTVVSVLLEAACGGTPASSSSFSSASDGSAARAAARAALAALGFAAGARAAPLVAELAPGKGGGGGGSGGNSSKNGSNAFVQREPCVDDQAYASRLIFLLAASRASPSVASLLPRHALDAAGVLSARHAGAALFPGEGCGGWGEGPSPSSAVEAEEGGGEGPGRRGPRAASKERGTVETARAVCRVAGEQRRRFRRRGRPAPASREAGARPPARRGSALSARAQRRRRRERHRRGGPHRRPGPGRASRRYKGEEDGEEKGGEEDEEEEEGRKSEEEELEDAGTAARSTRRRSRVPRGRPFPLPRSEEARAPRRRPRAGLYGVGGAGKESGSSPWWKKRHTAFAAEVGPLQRVALVAVAADDEEEGTRLSSARRRRRGRCLRCRPCPRGLDRARPLRSRGGPSKGVARAVPLLLRRRRSRRRRRIDLLRRRRGAALSGRAALAPGRGRGLAAPAARGGRESQLVSFFFFFV